MTLKIGSCEVHVRSDNEVAPVVTCIDSEHFRVEPICKCGAPSMAIGEFDDASNLILSNMSEQRRMSEKTHVAMPFDREYRKILKAECGGCKRQWVVTINYFLTDSILKDFKKEHTSGNLTILHGSMMKVNVEIENGYFPELNPFEQLKQILHPLHACSNQLTPAPLIDAAQKSIDAIDNYWETGKQSDEIKIDFSEKCPYCLNDYKIKAAFTPLHPLKNSAPYISAKLYETWQKRNR